MTAGLALMRSLAGVRGVTPAMSAALALVAAVGSVFADTVVLTAR